MTEHKLNQSHSELDHYISLLHATLNATSDGVLVIDLEGNATIYNDVFKKMWKIPDKILTTGEDQKLIAHVIEQLKDPNEFLKKVREMYRNAEAESFDFLEFKDQKVFERHSSPQRLGNEIVGRVWSFRDVTEKRRAAQKTEFLTRINEVLADSLDFNETLESLAHLIVPELADCCLVNLLQEDGSLREIFSHHTDPTMDLALQKLRSLFKNTPNKRHHYLKVFETKQSYLSTTALELTQSICAFQSDEFTKLFNEFGLTSGMCVPLQSRGVVIGVITLFSTSEEYHYSNLDLDLAEEISHRAAVALTSAGLYKKAQDAIKMRQDILAIVSHELRNSLTTILLGAQLLNRSKNITHEFAVKQSDSILRAGSQMQRLIQDLLEQAKLESVGFSMNIQKHEIKSLLENSAETLRPLAFQKGVKIKLNLPEHECYSNCDKDRVYQVLLNLVSNSIKFSPEGSEITLQATEQEKVILFSVRDQGTGISKNQALSVFKPYWQAKEHMCKGIGLGLSIAKEIVTAHGGTIWVDSIQGIGSTFKFTLPKIPAKEVI